jgi:NADH-quinone oxidoreductase subunit N
MNKAVSFLDMVIVAPMIAMFVISWIPLFIKVFNKNKEPNPFATLIYNFVGLTVATGLTASITGAKTMAFSGALVVDGVSIWTSYLVFLSTAVALMMAYDHVATRSRQFAEFCFLMTSSAIGMLMLLMANDLIVVFLAIEMMSLCLYVLVAMSREELLSKEAAFKYFVLGSFASAIFLYGIALIYGSVGSTYFQALHKGLPQLITASPVFIIGFTMLLIGFAFKASIFPFQFWTPDVYQGSATPVTSFMATAGKVAIFVCLLRIFDTKGLANSPSLLMVLSWMAALTMLIGNVGAIMQTNFKRMLAYSSVSHSGYILVGLIAAGFGNNFQAGAVSVLFYLFSYSIMTLGTFAFVGLFEADVDRQMTVDDLKGLGSRQPMLAFGLTILLLSLAGVPPLLGFFGKFYLFSAAVEQDLYWLALWGVLNSVISVYYYLRPVVSMYMTEGAGEEPIEMSQMTRMAVICAAMLIVVIGVLSSPLLKAVQRSVMSLF